MRTHHRQHPNVHSMQQAHLKKFRIVISLLVFVSLLFLFLGIGMQPFNRMADGLLLLQFIPSVLRFSALFFSISALGFVLIIILSLLFGRIYCSSLCPLGTFQDIVIATGRKLQPGKKRKFHYTPNKKRILRYGILTATVVAWISGSLFLVNLLDPYANFGKLSVSLFQPAYIWLYNNLAFVLERLDLFWMAPKTMHTLPWNTVLVSAGIFLAITGMSVWRGRLFCNTLCPAGSALGLLSESPLYRITFDDRECTGCRRCEWVCKAECLDSKAGSVDHGRCVSCFNCIASCPNRGIRYALARKAKRRTAAAKPLADNTKRQFMLTMASGLLGVPLLRNSVLYAQGASEPGMIPPERQLPVTPPGSLSHRHFNRHCIACYLCVSACPTNVIVPSFFDFGLHGFMQPRLDYHKNFCNYDCTRCTEVCPTGAITRQSEEEKKQIKIGEVRFLVESCVVTVDRTDCGACSEHCPTKAVQMVPYEDGLFIPEIHPELCVGCGACEYACPTEPYKAIYVTGLPVHKKATPIEEVDGPREDDADDFPF